MHTKALVLAVLAVVLLALPGKAAAADTPWAYASEARLHYGIAPAGADAVTADQAVEGFRGWTAVLYPASGSLTNARVSLDRADPAWVFRPPVTFPISAAAPTLDSPAYLQLNDISGFHGSGVYGSYAPGFAATRTTHVTTNPDGTFRVHVEVTTGAVATRWRGLYGRLNVAILPGGAGAALDTGSFAPPAGALYPSADASRVSWSVDPSVLQATGSVDITLPSSYPSPSAYRPWVQVGASVDTPTIFSAGTTATIDDSELGGTWTFASDTPANWGTSTQTLYTLELLAVIPHLPEPVQASVYRVANASVPGTVDSVSASAVYDGIWTWNPQMYNSTGVDLPSPTISLNGVDARWTDPLTPLPSFPITETAPTFYDNSNFPYGSQYDASHMALGYRFGFHAPVMPGHDVAWTLISPATDVVPAGGGTQRWSLTVTLRNPSFAGSQLMVQLEPQWTMSGATVVPGSVVTPTLSDGETLVGFDTNGGHLWWSVWRAVVDKPYTLTFDLAVPNTGVLPVAFRPGVWTSVALPMDSQNGTDGTSTTIADSYLGGTFTFSVGTPVHWYAGSGASVDVSFAQRGPTVLSNRAVVADAAGAAASISPAAAADLTAAGAAAYWVNDDHLAPATGVRVFQLTKAAVLKLSAAPRIVAELYTVDRKVAATAVSDAAARGQAPQLDAAVKQLAAGDASRAAGTPDAIDHYKNAWNDAEQALR